MTIWYRNSGKRSREIFDQTKNFLGSSIIDVEQNSLTKELILKRLMIDDVRGFFMVFDECNVPSMSEMKADPKYVFVEARTFDKGIEELKNNGPWDELYLDNDLGHYDNDKTGYGIMKWLEMPENRKYTPKVIIVISGNSAAVERIFLAHQGMKQNGFIPEDYKMYRSWI